MKRLIYVVLDGVGVGALPDAAEYGDEDSDTLGNTSRAAGLDVPFLERLGLGSIAPLAGVSPAERAAGFVGRLAPLSPGKDTTVGHWEQMGLLTPRPFPTYPDGFPPDIITEFSRRIGRGILGNRAASGTEIIAALGDDHVATGRPIVYTSADSVFQVAAHVGIVPLDRLYSWCAIARDLLTGRHGVARVIARPFSGESGGYFRTSDRRDLSLQPPGPTYLDRLQEQGVEVLALGKISEIFAHRGVDRSFKVESNQDNLDLLEELIRSTKLDASEKNRLIITNLVDFDTAWGHRNDVDAFARGLHEADEGLSRVAGLLGSDDALLITADHGVDPTTPSTDHSREYVPVLLYPSPSPTPRAVYDGEFSDAGAYAFEYLAERTADLAGRSFSELDPGRGWRRCTPVQQRKSGTVAGIPGRVGGPEAGDAGKWLLRHLGPAPDMAVVLGSGLSLAETVAMEGEVAYEAVPHWGVGLVPGHPYRLAVLRVGGTRCAIMRGRLHEYEGLDLSEVQLPIRSLAAWGIRSVLLTSAGGAVADGVAAGDVLVVDRVLDLQYRGDDGWPVLIEATPPTAVAALLGAKSSGGGLLTAGVHASVPGPQYETPAELHMLRSLGVSAVSMTPAAELRGALDEGMNVAVLTVVTNAGDTTHTEVLKVGKLVSRELTAAVGALCQNWK